MTLRWVDDLSIRAKLLGLMMLSAMVALVLAGVAIIVHDSVTFRRQKVQDLNTQAEMLGAICSAALTFDDPRAAEEYLATLRARADVKAAALYDARGRLFATYGRDPEEGHRPAPASGDGPGKEGYRIMGDELVLSHRVASGPEALGTVVLRADMGLVGRRRRYEGIVLAVLLGSIAGAYLLSMRLQALVSVRLLAVTDAARSVVEREDYSPRVEDPSRDEVGILVQAFNQMLVRIREREAALRASNQALQSEILEHKAAREEIAALNRTLESRVAERTADLEASNRELESFSYSVSHDLRAPLRGIDGFTLLLEKNYQECLDATGQDYLRRVRAATQRMGHLIDDLLKLSRTARSEMVRRPVDLADLARTIVQELRDGDPGRSVTVEIAPRLPAYADAGLMRVVLENLLGNAWKFTRKVPDPRIEMGSLQRDGRTVYYVKDNGAGFDMTYAEKLFRPFQRLHSAVEFEGTGVGLANVQRVIRRHGGTVWAEGAPGEGATMYFTIAEQGGER